MKKQICFLYRLFIIITYSNGILADVRIKPNVSEITLTSEADYELMCAGDVPVTWNFTYYNQNPSLEKISSIDIVSKKLENIFGEYNNNYQYSSVLTLSKVSYLVTGNYYCNPSSPEVKLDENNSKHIYIYVQHKTHLLAVPEDLNKLYQDEFGEVIIPCRPTTPDVNVTLKKDNQVFLDYLYYDDKKGFLLRSFLFQVSYEYSCEANKKNINETRNFTVYINPNATQININTDSDIIVKGENLRLNCTVTTFFDDSLIINWKLTDKQKLRAQSRNVFKNSNRVGIIYNVYTLLLQHVSTEDDGEYVCEVKMRSGRIINATYDLKSVESGTYLNLKIIDGEYKVIRPTGFKSVQWVIKISAYPDANHRWINENGEEVIQHNYKNDKIYLKTNKTLSKFVIKNLELSDSMMYKLIADNGFYKKEISVTLSVKGQPFANIKYEDIFKTYEVGKTYNFKCIANGNPLPKIEWIFRNCSRYPECESKTQKPIFKFINNIIYFKSSKLEVISAIELNITEAGKLLCKTSNELGNSMDEYEIPATDVPKHFYIIGPHNIDVGETVTIECGVSKYKYKNEIKWSYKAVNDENISMTSYFNPLISYISNHTDKNIIITTNETKFSYRSYLTIKNTTTNYSRTYSCYADEKVQLVYFVKLLPLSLKLTVVDLSAPVFYNTSNANSQMEIGEPVQWRCYAYGIPSPTISWYKDNQSLRFDKHNKRLLLQDNNQTLLITSIELEDRGSYECHVSNKKGSIVSTNILIVTDERGYREKKNFVIFYSVTAMLIGVLIIVCVMYSKRSQKFKKELALATLNFENGAIESWNPDLTIEEQAELLPYNKEWEFPTNKLKLGKKLGSGAFGVVYKAEAIGIIDKNTITTVAVKTVRPSTDLFYTNSLTSELKIMIHLGKHLNVINLLGACTGNISKNLMVIVEYCRFGNIHQYILKRRDRFVDQITPDGSLNFEMQTTSKYFINLHYEMGSKEITQSKEQTDDTAISFDSTSRIKGDLQWRSSQHIDFENDVDRPLCTHDLVCWAFQISRGMAYLASRRILHGDLAARNILLADENVIKICDFGLAKNMYKSDNYKKKSNKDLLPVKWMAIESLRDRVFSTQSDVWAFGIVLWEMFSLSVTPYPNIQSVNDLYNNLIEGYRMERPRYSSSEIYDIMLECWKMDPSSRPSFNDLADIIGALLERSTTSHYINLNENYVLKNTKGSLSTDYFSLVTSPTYVNCMPISENNTNPSSENKDDLALKPIFHKLN